MYKRSGTPVSRKAPRRALPVVKCQNETRFQALILMHNHLCPTALVAPPKVGLAVPALVHPAMSCGGATVANAGAAQPGVADSVASLSSASFIQLGAAAEARPKIALAIAASVFTAVVGGGSAVADA